MRVVLANDQVILRSYDLRNEARSDFRVVLDEVSFGLDHFTQVFHIHELAIFYDFRLILLELLKLFV